MYRYQALNPEGEFVEGDMQQTSEQAVIDALLEMNFIPLKIIGQDKTRTKNRWKGLHLRRPRFDSQSFFENLHDYLESGLSIDRALELESRNVQSGQQGLTRDMLARIREGEPLSKVMSSWPSVFSPLQIGLVRVGEETDSLAQSLSLLSRLLHDLQVFRERLRSALAYPVVLMLVMLLSMLVLFTVVVPRFKPLFTGMGVEIEGMTRLVIGLSDFLLQQGTLLLLMLLGLVLGVRLVMKTPGLRRRMSHLAMSLPLLGSLIRQYNLYLFSMMMQVMMKKRITVIESLEYLKDGLENEAYRSRLDPMIEEVRRGGSLSDTLSGSLFPEHFIYLVKVGEETGRLADAFSRLSAFYYKRLNERIKVAMTYVEPAIILLLGLMVGFIVISMLQTLLSINELVA